MASKNVKQSASGGFESYQVGIAAEAFAAGLLAHAGYEVLVQYGANQPLYDLIAVKGNRSLKVSVKGSKDGGWVFTAGLKAGRTYHEAADCWLEKHGTDIVFFLLQFEGVQPGMMPRAYVALARDVAKHLKSVHLGRGDTRFAEKQTYHGGTAKGHTDQIPDHWTFSLARVDSV